METIPGGLENIMLIGIMSLIIYFVLAILIRSLLLWLFAKLLEFKEPRYITALLVALITVGVSFIFNFIFYLVRVPLMGFNSDLESIVGYLMHLPGFIAEIIALKYMYKTSWGKAIANGLLTGLVLLILLILLVFIYVMIIAIFGF